ncbi:MAG: type II toxin-antitoxin system antitoxin SocA domain-containing protein [Thermoanaerobaculia bacterium]
MATVHDVAAYMLRKQGEMTAMKLEKLVYYSQAWSLVWDEEPLFKEGIQAWVNGPVVPALYRCHRGMFKVADWPEGDPDKLSPKQRETIDAVLSYYGNKSSQWLSDLTHREAPWIQARKGLEPGDPCKREISHASMAEYYSNPY